MANVDKIYKRIWEGKENSLSTLCPYIQFLGGMYMDN